MERALIVRNLSYYFFGNKSTRKVCVKGDYTGNDEIPRSRRAHSNERR
jgi:hypothetical protein